MKQRMKSKKTMKKDDDEGYDGDIDEDMPLSDLYKKMADDMKCSNGSKDITVEDYEVMTNKMLSYITEYAFTTGDQPLDDNMNKFFEGLMMSMTGDVEDAIQHSQ